VSKSAACELSHVLNCKTLWELYDHLPYSPDLAPRDYHLLTYLKNWLQSQRFNNNDDELMEGVKMWLSSRLL
jgi:hypothetical protein